MAYNVTSFFVVPRLPKTLEELDVIAHNLWWSWNRDAIDLFRRMDGALWQVSGHNPVRMLSSMDQKRLEELAVDEAFLLHLKRVAESLKSHLSARMWYQRAADEGKQHRVAYFCMEFGITEALPIYSGGLGVLAGDHLQSASELGFPLTGVGLMYAEGYFHQTLSAEGWQQESYPNNDLPSLPVRRVLKPDGTPVTVHVQCPHPIQVQAWRADVGRIPLYLLTTDVDGNAPGDRAITNRLYGGDKEMRIRQEIVLGIGGLKLLRAIDAEPTVIHLNEGHSVFSLLERIRHLREQTGLPFDAAREAASAGALFTTHTPVPAGNEEFSHELVDRYFSHMYGSLGLDRSTFLELGHKPGQPGRFNLTVLALRLAAGANAVSKLHGVVARKMWRDLWKDAVVEEVPIGHVTNGVHTRSWVSRDVVELLDHHLGPRWSGNPEDTEIWKSIDAVPDDELWRVHERRRERLVGYVRKRVARQVQQRRGAASEMEAIRDLLDPRALTIGFARRFATYKRAGLIARDLERLEKLLNDPHRPIQLIFAGKAHPQDEGGKKLIQRIFQLCRDERTRRRVAFLQDYSIEVARHMAQGVDVWLNTPRRPHEASGTSGMKVAANGGLNCSILDGWWDEAVSMGAHDKSDVGWAIGSGEEFAEEDAEAGDELEARSLYSVLEDEVIPLFYQRGRDGIPHDWVRRMKSSMRIIGPYFNTMRMVAEYARKYYFPLHDRFTLLTKDANKKALELTEYRHRLAASWADVRIGQVDTKLGRTVHVGESVQVEAEVHLGKLSVGEVRVEVLHGLLGASGFVEPHSVPMVAGDSGSSVVMYRAEVPCQKSGQNGVAVRVLPQHELMVPRDVLARVVWRR